MTGPRVVLAVNPTSGRGRGARAGEVAADRLRAAGFDVAVLIGVDADDLRRRMAAELAAGCAALVVAGGDGMANLGVNAVAGTTVPLGIVPAGTGNDLARMLGLPPGDPGAAADVAGAALREGARRRIDAVRCTWGAGECRWFAGVLAAGFDAVVNERANGWRRPAGRPKYVLAVLRELPVLRPRTYRLELDGEPWEVEAMLVAVGNAPSYGGGMRVTPDADPADGLVDVMVVGRVTTPEFLRVFPRVYAGTHVTHPAVTVRRAKVVRVVTDGIVAYADGERFGPLPVTCEVVPAAVSTLAGPDQPRTTA